MNGASSESYEPVVTGERLADAHRVDGNAAAGILSELFACGSMRRVPRPSSSPEDHERKLRNCANG